MEKQGRDGGKFVSKGNEPRAVRSIRLTDTAWEALGDAAIASNGTRADYIEALVKEGVIGSGAELERAHVRNEFIYELEEILEEILENESLTRNGKDRGVIKRIHAAILLALGANV